ncbi:MAG: hypothetical protein ACWGO1_12880, partial [Anaerolineales bacterium]
TLLLWIPYLIIIIGFLSWRLVYYPTERGDVQLFDKIAAEPTGTLMELAETAFQDVINAGLVAWAQVLDLVRMTSFGRGPTLLYSAGVIIAVASAIFYLSRLQPASESARSGNRYSSWAKQALPLGAAALLLAGIPFWVTNLPIGLEFPWDRFTLAMMFGSSLVVAGLVDLVARKKL